MNASRARGAFSLIDLLVSVAVTGVLIAVLLPALARAGESANRVRCASNIRQLGFALQMYAQDNGDQPPDTTFATPPPQPDKTVLIRTAVGGDSLKWDGLGKLYALEYAPHHDVFYCPSHRGNHSASKHVDAFLSGDGAITCNYQYRIIDRRYLTMVPNGTSLIADGMRTKADYNHRIGNNVLRADYSVTWFSDADGELFQTLADTPAGTNAKEFETSWAILDLGKPPSKVGEGGADIGQ